MNSTKIEYVDMTWNPVTGCSPEYACWQYCWARRMAEGRLRGRCGYDSDHPFRPTFHPDRLDQPAKLKKPKRIAVCFMGDLWADDVKPEWRAAVIRATNAAPQHQYFFLTKRIEKAAKEIYWLAMPNFWLGTTITNQTEADERLPWLLKAVCLHRWVSIEPMRGPVCLRNHLRTLFCPPDIHWVVLGGGPEPLHPEWVRDVRDQCAAVGVPFHFKQWGSWQNGSSRDGRNEIMLNDGRHGKTYIDLGTENINSTKWALLKPTMMSRVGRRAAGRILDGRTHDEVPDHV